MDQKEQALRDELNDLQKKLQDPAIFSSKDYPKLARRQNQLEEIVGLIDEIAKLKKM